MPVVPPVVYDVPEGRLSQAMRALGYLLAVNDLLTSVDNIFYNGKGVHPWLHSIASSREVGVIQVASGATYLGGAAAYTELVLSRGGSMIGPAGMIGIGAYNLTSGLNKMCDSCISTFALDAVTGVLQGPNRDTWYRQMYPYPTL